MTNSIPMFADGPHIPWSPQERPPDLHHGSGFSGTPADRSHAQLSHRRSTPDPVIEPTRDEATKATPVVWPGPLVVPHPPGEAWCLQHRRVPGAV